jgi:NAD(P)-dependent dehydrogenase (short-subunit alcohol dehydrogenase family)
LDILTPEADLEDDLGFGGEQRAAIAQALRSRLHLNFVHTSLPVTVRTIGDIVTLIEPLRSPLASSPIRTSSSARSDGNILPNSLPYLAEARPFAGRIALVTGSGHGLGKVIAQQLGGLGATVVVNSFHSRARGEDTAAQINSAGGHAFHVWGSVANSSHLEKIFDEVGERFGSLDYFISNASNGVLARLKDVTPEHWERAFRTSVVALHQGALLAAQLMGRRGGGKIVAISSNGSQRFLDYFGCMGPVKAAVECLVRYLAVELGPENIQVNGVSAGPICGELLEKYPDYDKLRPRWEAVVPRG